MADLLGFVDLIEGGGPGFLVPVFRVFAGANAQSIQVLDTFDRVVGFKDVEVARPMFVPTSIVLALDLKDPGVWAFRDGRGKIHVETATGLRTVVADLIEAGALSEQPLLAAELVEFCRLSRTYPRVLLQAYGLLSIESERAADVWRDTQLFAPAVRRDMVQNANLMGAARVEDDLIVLGGRDVVEIYAEHPWPGAVPMPEVTALAGIFGIRKVVVLPLPKARPKAPEATDDYLFAGVGGVARSFAREPRFPITLVRWGETGNTGGVVGQGSTLDWNGGVTAERPLYLTLAQSDFEQIERVIDVARSAPKHAVRHLINIRPIGHTPYRPGRVELDDLAASVRDFDLVWIIANHRHRKLAQRPNNLAASSFAGRTARSLILSLLSRHGRPPEPAGVLGNRRGPAFALAGMARPPKGEAVKDTVRRVLHAMLADEAMLHTATEIVVLLPDFGDDTGHPMTLSLGNHEYRVRLLSRVNPGRSKEVVGWALDVRLSHGEPQAYRDFCIGLLAGYGWEFHAIDGPTFIISCRHDKRRVWIANSHRQLNAVLGRQPIGGGDVIITNQATPPEMVRYAEARGFTLLHHAQIAAWMAEEFGARAFEPW